MKELMFKLSKLYAIPKYKLSEAWWSFKFKTLCTYYKGGKNIPPAMLRRWCPIDGDAITAACFGASEHIVAMEKFFGLTPRNDIAMAYFSGFMYGTSMCLRHDVIGQRIALATYPAKQYFRCLYIHSNYQRKIKHLLSQPDKLTEFRELLTRQNEHLTLSIDV